MQNKYSHPNNRYYTSRIEYLYKYLHNFYFSNRVYILMFYIKNKTNATRLIFYNLTKFIFGRSFKEETILAIRYGRISTGTGPITKTDSAIPPKNFGWAMKIFICLPAMTNTCWESKWKISKETEGNIDS